MTLFHHTFWTGFWGPPWARHRDFLCEVQEVGKNWNFIPTDPRINRKKLVSLGRVLEIYSKRNTTNKMGYIMVVYRLVLRARWGNILGTTATGYPPKVSPNECGWWPALTRNVLIHPRYRRYWDIGSPPMKKSTKNGHEWKGSTITLGDGTSCRSMGTMVKQGSSKYFVTLWGVSQVDKHKFTKAHFVKQSRSTLHPSKTDIFGHCSCCCQSFLGVRGWIVTEISTSTWFFSRLING